MSPKRKAHDVDVARKLQEADPDGNGMRRAFVHRAQTAPVAELVEWSVKAHRGAKLTGGKPGRKAAKLEPIRAYLRDLHEQHPDAKAPALVRMANSRNPKLFEKRALTTVEDLAREVIKEK